MTVIIAIAVRPKEKELPYFLMASDSKRILMQEDEQGVLHTVKVEEDFKKIHMVGNRVLGIAGKIEEEFIVELIATLAETNIDFEAFARRAFELTKNHILNKSQFEFARCNVVIGENRNYQPKLAQFLIIKNDKNESTFNIASPEIGNAIPVRIGNVQGTDDLFERFCVRARNAVNLNSYVVKKAAKEYIEEVAERVPEFCNKNVVFKKI